MKRKTNFTAWGFFLFFLTNTVAVSMAIWVYSRLEQKGEKYLTIALVMLLVILFLTVLFTLIDFIRRRAMVERPAEEILSATERIAAGDFSVRLRPLHSYERYNQYDKIMENLNIMAAELGKSEMLKSDFISNVSHELKTPIAIIRNYANLLKNADLDAATREKYAQTLVTASGRLSDLVTNILKLNKLENEKILPEKERFSLTDSLAEAVLTYEDLIEKKGLEIQTDMDEVEIFSMKSYLDIVWNNLISNAIKFTNEGGRVALKLKKEGDNAIVCVEDSGCGIPPETGKHIFDKFYQGDASHAAEGNGLGLAMVKKVIDILGGEISVESEVGKGSTFKVVLKNAVV